MPFDLSRPHVTGWAEAANLRRFAAPIFENAPVERRKAGYRRCRDKLRTLFDYEKQRFPQEVRCDELPVEIDAQPMRECVWDRSSYAQGELASCEPTSLSKPPADLEGP